ncbi:MAG: glycosyltransferase [Anaerolineae bacterium]|nr:glycosyltransferase [Anaerolineae bacterium]
MHVVYLIGCYPSITLTFIEREICALEEQGVSINIISMVRPQEDEVLEEARWRIPHIFYTRPVRPALLLRALARHALTAPVTFWSTFAWLLTRPHPSLHARLKTVLHFAQGVYVAEYLRRRGGDHLHAHFADRATVIALVASRLLGLSFSFTAHAKDIYAEDVFLADKVAESAFVVTCTEANASYLRQIASSPEKIYRSYHGLPLSQLPFRVSEPQTVPLILSVGRLVEKKGFSHLLDACAILRDRGIAFHCMIIGEGPERTRLERQRALLGLNDLVSLPGSQPFAEVVTAMRCAAVFVQPSVIAQNNDRDGIPNVVLEAMAMGVPIVSTEVSAIPEVVQHDVTGLLVPQRDAVALAEALARLLSDAALRAHLVRQARRLVQANFDVGRNVVQLRELFAESIAQRSSVLQAPIVLPG